MLFIICYVSVIVLVQGGGYSNKENRIVPYIFAAHEEGG